ncbi:hypothetical protein, partial [Streptomyces harbinensis]|uniref:hypothetical protein n=1 Tax=Streptomyces harbinensis TaxID=1176198 RepID=UPI0034DF2509
LMGSRAHQPEPAGAMVRGVTTTRLDSGFVAAAASRIAAALAAKAPYISQRWHQRATAPAR